MASMLREFPGYTARTLMNDFDDPDLVGLMGGLTADMDARAIVYRNQTEGKKFSPDPVTDDDEFTRLQKASTIRHTKSKATMAKADRVLADKFPGAF